MQLPHHYTCVCSPGVEVERWHRPGVAVYCLDCGRDLAAQRMDQKVIDVLRRARALILAAGEDAAFLDWLA